MFQRRITFALFSLALLALVQGGVAYWAAGLAAYHVERGRLTSDILGGFVEISANKQRLRAWMAQTLVGAEAPVDARDRALTDMRGSLTQLSGLAARLAELHRGREASPADGERQRALSILDDNLRELGAQLATVPPYESAAQTRQVWNTFARVFNESQGEDLRRLLTTAIERERAATAAARSAADQAQRLMRNVITSVTLTSALATVLLAAYFRRNLRRPLGDLLAGTRALQRGDLTHRIPAERRDEFGGLAQSFNAMASELQHHREEEEAARSRLEAEVSQRTAALRAANNTLQRLDARRRHFFADISHELRTPATAIRGEAEVALRGGDKPVDEYQQALARIVATTQQLTVVIDDLLLIARSDVDQLTMHPTDADLPDLLQDSCERAAALGAPLGVTLGLDEPAEPAAARVVRGDRDRLLQLFMIVLDNAVRYSQPGGRVLVAWSTAPGLLIVTVRNHGLGIDPAELDSVFERHFRGRQAQRQGPVGSGLGLSIALMIARAHQGYINLDSDPELGTTVTITLPATHEAAVLADAAADR